MYLADSIEFEPSITPRIFPNKKATFTVIFSPKSEFIQNTLEYFTLFSINNQNKTINDEFAECESLQSEHGDVGEDDQKVIVCVQGSCYGKCSSYSHAKC